MKVGNLVSAIDEDISGVVKAINNDLITIMTSEGFELQFFKNELVQEEQDISSLITNDAVSAILAEKESPKRKKPKKNKTKERNAPPMEVDLHIHQLTNAKHLSNYEMLTIQLDTAKRQLEFAISKRIQKVVFIHGVGAGVLKAELEYLFKRYDTVSFYDAKYQKYGVGATEVYIHQNKKK